MDTYDVVYYCSWTRRCDGCNYMIDHSKSNHIKDGFCHILKCKSPHNLRFNCRADVGKEDKGKVASLINPNKDHYDWSGR